MHFASDNAAGVMPEIIDALAAANDGYALAYGNDDRTRGLERTLSDLFEREVAMFLVSTGTAANALALAHVTPPWAGVLCHADAHINTDECGAPEFFGGGVKLIGLEGQNGKLAAETLQAALDRYQGHRPHQVNAGALSLTQATESGTLYRPDEIAALAERAHRRGLKVHMDGARFGNALVRLNATPAEMTWKAGIDVLSFGATKGGAMAAEAVLFFDPALAGTMPERRKRGAHLVSKHRFVAAQFEAFLAGGRWLAAARHANRMADRLAQRLLAAGLRLVWPVEANLVFAIFSPAQDARMRAAGATYYARSGHMIPAALRGSPDDVLVRMVTSFATREADIDRFADLMTMA